MSALALPSNASRRRQFLHGFLLPFRLIRATRRDEGTRRAYRRCMMVQALVVVVLAVCATGGAYYGVKRLAAQSDMDVRIDATGVHIHQRMDLGEGAPPAAPDAESEGELGTRRSLLEGMDGLPEPVRWVAAFFYLLYVALCFFEWLVIALSRDFHDQIGRRVALIAGIAPEDPEAKPWIRLNLRWLWSKAKRRARGLRVILFGVPVLLAAEIFPSPWGMVSAVVGTAWTGYWISVFVGAKSALAWRDEKTAGDPWFLRAWSALEQRTRLWRWWLPRAYARLWRKGSRAVFAPCARFEEAPWQLAGLGLVRVLGGLPVFYLFVRPMIPVAAAHIISNRAPPPPVGWAPPPCGDRVAQRILAGRPDSGRRAAMTSTRRAMDDECVLLEQWRTGDLVAGNDLFERHYDSVYRFFAHKVDADCVADLVQRTFLACVEALHRFRGHSSFRTFLFGIARNELFAHIRRRARQPGLDVPMSSIIDLGASPSALAHDATEQRILLEALRSIPLDLQIAVELHYWEGLSGPDLARVMEIPEGTVRSRLHRARDLLRARLTELGSSNARLASTVQDIEGWAASLEALMRRHQERSSG